MSQSFINNIIKRFTEDIDWCMNWSKAESAEFHDQIQKLVYEKIKEIQKNDT